jgi:hypothetical protein
MEHPSAAPNVVPIKSAGQHADVLQSARSATQVALPAILSEVLARVDDALFDLVQKSHSTFEQQQFFDAMRELRRQRSALEQRYREHFLAAFLGIERRKPIEARYAQPGDTNNELSLLHEDELEEQLAAEQVALAIERRHSSILMQLDRQFTVLAGGIPINSMLNPVGPGHVAAALRSGLRGCELAVSARLVLFKLYEQALLASLGAFYAELHRRISAGGVGVPAGAPRVMLPPRQVSPSSGGGAGNGGTHGGPVGYAGGAAPMGAPGGSYAGGDSAPYPLNVRPEEMHVRDDLFAALHGLLEDYRTVQRGGREEPQAPAGNDAREPVPPLAGGEALSMLSLLQRELPASVHAAVNDPKQSLAGQIKRELMAQAERMGVGQPGAALTPPDEDAIDLVGMLFEVLLSERKFQDDVRGMFTQMIVPFTKVAMLDRRMFMHKTHPARRMLNAVAEACDGNTGESALERELLERVEGLVDRLVAEFNEDLAIFEALQEEFGSFLEQHRKRVDLAEKRAAEAQRGRERLEQARAVASMELATLMGARDAPPAIEGFLRRFWAHHVSVVILRDGAESERFQQARASGEFLWSAMIACETGGEKPASLRAVLEPVLLSSGVTGESANDVIASIEAVLDALRAGDTARVEASALPGVEGDDAGAHAMSSEVASPGLAVTPAFAGATTVRRAVDAIPGELSEPTASDREAASRSASFWEQPVAGVPEAPQAAAEPEPAPAVEADPADVERIRKLEVGAWVEMISDDGTPQPAKLSWVSPISSRLLFVNRRGMRVCASSAEELAVMLKQGKLNLREIDTAFERAMTQVLGKLRETQGQRPNA